MEGSVKELALYRLDFYIASKEEVETQLKNAKKFFAEIEKYINKML